MYQMIQNVPDIEPDEKSYMECSGTQFFAPLTFMLYLCP